MYFHLLYHKSKEQEEILFNFRCLNNYSQVFCCIALFKFSVLKHLKNQGAFGTTLKKVANLSLVLLYYYLSLNFNWL